MVSRIEKGFHSERADDQKWRCYGETRRKELITNDEKAGGTSFHLSSDCRIEHYFQLAERVTLQFHELCRGKLTDYEDAYVRGYRIMTFLSKALPQHPDYQSPQLANLRSKVDHNLRWIARKMSEISNAIDEEQLNNFILNDYFPDPEVDNDDEDDDSSSVASDDAETGGKSFTLNSDHWETFEGWTFHPNSGTIGSKLSEQWISKSQTVPGVIETDDSTLSFDHQSVASENNLAEVHSPRISGKFENQVNSNTLAPSGESVPESVQRIEQDCRHVPDPEPVLCDSFEEDDDDDDDEQGINSSTPMSYQIEIDIMEARFLQKVAREDVRFETDSDAMDSWAPNNAGRNGSEISAGNEFTCDPARIAFREIMRTYPRSRSIQANVVHTANISTANSPTKSPRRKLLQQHRKIVIKRRHQTLTSRQQV